MEEWSEHGGAGGEKEEEEKWRRQVGRGREPEWSKEVEVPGGETWWTR